MQIEENIIWVYDNYCQGLPFKQSKNYYSCAAWKCGEAYSPVTIFYPGSYETETMQASEYYTALNNITIYNYTRQDKSYLIGPKNVYNYVALNARPIYDVFDTRSCDSCDVGDGVSGSFGIGPGSQWFN